MLLPNSKCNTFLAKCLVVQTRLVKVANGLKTFYIHLYLLRM